MAKRNKNPNPQQNPEPEIVPSVEAPTPAPAPLEPVVATPVVNPEPEIEKPAKKNPRRSRKARKHGKRRGKKARKNPMATWAKVAIGVGAVVSTFAIGYGIYSKVTAKNRKLACGAKYQGLVVTASGYTLDDPGSDLPFAGQTTYSEWYELAQDLALQAYQRFKELGQIECESTGGTNCASDDASGGHYPRWDALVALNNRMHGKLEALSGPFFTTNYSLSRSQAQSVIKDAICLMEQADDGIQSYGGTVPMAPSFGEAAPSRAPAWQWAAFGGAAVLTLGGIGWALGKPSSSASTPHRPELPTARASRPE